MKATAKWLSAIAAPALMLGIATVPAGAAVAKGGTTNPFFAGYMAVVNGSTVQSFQYVQATFTVPALNCAQTPTANSTQGVSLVSSSTGANPNNTAELQENCQGGSPSYQAAWSSGCNGHGGVMPLTISPGDDVKLSVLNGTISVFDLTTGASAGAPLSTACGANLSAIAFSAGPGAVADFTQVGFRQIQVQASNQTTPRPLVSPGWSVKQFILRGPSGRDDVTPEALLSGKFTSAFANDWQFSN